MSELMPDRMSHRMADRMSKDMSERMSEELYAIYTSRWHVRNYVRIVFQGGDHSKKVIKFSKTYSIFSFGDGSTTIEIY